MYDYERKFELCPSQAKIIQGCDLDVSSGVAALTITFVDKSMSLTVITCRF